MNELQIFNNEDFGEIRTVTIDNDPWFVASDICKALDIANTTQAMQRLDDDEKSMLNIGLSGGATNCVNEYGLYSLVLASRKKEAKDFKRWITHEVLPSIRKTGSYGKPLTTLEQIKLIAQGNMELGERVDKVEDKLSNLENDTPLYGCEIDEVQKHVRKKGVEVLGGKGSEAYRDGSVRSQVYSDIYNQLKREYGCVSSYKSIKRKYVDAVHVFIDRYEPPTALLEQIRDCNAQVRIA